MDQKYYNPLLEQPYEEFGYQDFTKKFLMKLNTKKKEPAGRKSAPNVLKKCPGMSPDAKVEASPAAWNLFLNPDVLKRVTQITTFMNSKKGLLLSWNQATKMQVNARILSWLTW